MYNILLVDDEPLILSGIKFLLDWEKNDCCIIGTSRNGEDALEKIRTQSPDIVLCDINMPRFSGIDLLRTVSEEQPNIVFIMLTNLQDFDLAQTALRHRAVDYILKSQLEAETLERSLALAKTECDNRGRLAAAQRVEHYERLSVTEQLRELFLHAAASGNITQVLPIVLGTQLFCGAQQLSACRAQMTGLRTCYYNDPSSPLLYADGSGAPAVRSLGLNGLALKLGQELRGRNLSGCHALLAHAIETVQTVEHKPEQGILLCHELFNTASEVLRTALSAGSRLPALLESADSAHEQIDHLLTRAQVAAWLARFSECVLLCAQEIVPPHPDFLEKAKEYVSSHLTERIMLTDVASYVNVSPSYLSSLFKKTHHQNFVDYINSRKMELACKMIRENRHKIYDICYQLGYENPYYFTRTFRRHIGMTPSEYQMRQRGAREDRTPEQ